MNEQEKETANLKSEILLEKVREIEAAKSEKSGEELSVKNNTSKILKENRELSAPMSEAEAKKNYVRAFAAQFFNRRRDGSGRNFRLAPAAGGNETIYSPPHF